MILLSFFSKLMAAAFPLACAIFWDQYLQLNKTLFTALAGENRKRSEYLALNKTCFSLHQHKVLGKGSRLPLLLLKSTGLRRMCFTKRLYFAFIMQSSKETLKL